MLMSRIKGGSGKGPSLDAWDIAATLGLVAIAFIVERTAPRITQNRPFRRRRAATPQPPASPAKKGTAGATRSHLQISRRRDGKTFFGAYTAM
jgi:hypothetical protein